jgi:uncharacterized protein YaiI (UPF0178 family)
VLQLKTSCISPMKIVQTFIVIVLSVAFISCQDVISLDVPVGDSQLVVDSWITNQMTPQTVKLTQSGGYFDNGTAKPALNAAVTITDERGKVFSFKDLKNNGIYTWQPANSRDTLGRIGGRYSLVIKLGEEEYRAQSRINRVPKIDSINYFFDSVPVVPNDSIAKEGYRAQFFGRDPIGEGDCYWIKSYRNNKYYNETFNIVVAYDAGFSPGSATDGLPFILPIRRSISQREFMQPKDTVKVELLSIGLDAFFFLNQIRQETNNAGLFATPPTNILSNVQNVNPKGRKPLGFFGASAVSTLKTVIDPKKARPKDS